MEMCMITAARSVPILQMAKLADNIHVDHAKTTLRAFYLHKSPRRSHLVQRCHYRVHDEHDAGQDRARQAQRRHEQHARAAHRFRLPGAVRILAVVGQLQPHVRHAQLQHVQRQAVQDGGQAAGLHAAERVGWCVRAVQQPHRAEHGVRQVEAQQADAVARRGEGLLERGRIVVQEDGHVLLDGELEVGGAHHERWRCRWGRSGSGGWSGRNGIVGRWRRRSGGCGGGFGGGGGVGGGRAMDQLLGGFGWGGHRFGSGDGHGDGGVKGGGASERTRARDVRLCVVTERD